jgi:hypothetical protein
MVVGLAGFSDFFGRIFLKNKKFVLKYAVHLRTHDTPSQNFSTFLTVFAENKRRYAIFLLNS